MDFMIALIIAELIILGYVWVKDKWDGWQVDRMNRNRPKSLGVAESLRAYYLPHLDI